MTAPGAYSAMLAPMPGDIAAACSAIQGILIHRDVAPWLYDIKLSEEARDLANVRPVAGMLSQIRALSNRPLTEAREPKQRMPAVCRHFATMFCGILREQGVPARARCGFGAFTSIRADSKIIGLPSTGTPHRIVGFWLTRSLTPCSARPSS
jgi:hypothetical protein